MKTYEEAIREILIPIFGKNSEYFAISYAVSVTVLIIILIIGRIINSTLLKNYMNNTNQITNWYIPAIYCSFLISNFLIVFSILNSKMMPILDLIKTYIIGVLVSTIFFAIMILLTPVARKLWKKLKFWD